MRSERDALTASFGSAASRDGDDSASRPVVGVVPLVDYERASYWMLPGYFEGVAAAGGLPVMLPLMADAQDVLQLARLCDAFLFTGGQDVSPTLYGQEAIEHCGETCPERDDLEQRLLDTALADDKPLLGICRGLQFMNAALGGTLHQDIPTQVPSGVVHCQKPPYDRPAHSVAVLPETPLARVVGVGELPVNSYHHQAICKLAPSLRPMAQAPDGLVEAVWMPEAHFVWAVQWHPEYSWRVDEASRKIFAAFVAAARVAAQGC